MDVNQTSRLNLCIPLRNRLMQYTHHITFETPNVHNQTCPNLVTPQRHSRLGGQIDQQIIDIDLNLSLDLLNIEKPLRKTRRSRRRGAKGGRTDVEPSGVQKQVTVSEAYL